MIYVLAGPATIGNIFGFFGKTVPVDRYVIVEDGEYSNGGYGPSQVIIGHFKSKEEAEERYEQESPSWGNHGTHHDR